MDLGDKDEERSRRRHSPQTWRTIRTGQGRGRYQRSSQASGMMRWRTQRRSKCRSVGREEKNRLLDLDFPCRLEDDLGAGDKRNLSTLPSGNRVARFPSEL